MSSSSVDSAEAAMFTTAHLSIDNFTTRVRLSHPGWRPGDPHDRFDVVRVDVDDRQDAADEELAVRGWRRTGVWAYDLLRDVYATTIAPLGSED